MRRLKWILMITIVAVLSGCSSNADKETHAVTQQDTEDGISFTDDLGREVTVHNPQRVAALLGSYADLWMLAPGP